MVFIQDFVMSDGILNIHLSAQSEEDASRQCYVSRYFATKLPRVSALEDLGGLYELSAASTEPVIVRRAVHDVDTTTGSSPELKGEAELRPCGFSSGSRLTRSPIGAWITEDVDQLGARTNYGLCQC